MKITFLILLTLSILFSISGCGSETEISDYKISELFGYTFGDIPDYIPDKYLADNQTFEAQNPKRQDPFTTYQITVTPKEHKIYGVMATSDSQFSSEECQNELNIMAKKLTEKYGQEEGLIAKGDSDGWILQEKNSRTVSLACSEVIGFESTVGNNYQLSLVAQDKALSIEAYQDWQKRQKSDEKFR